MLKTAKLRAAFPVVLLLLAGCANGRDPVGEDAPVARTGDVTFGLSSIPAGSNGVMITVSAAGGVKNLEVARDTGRADDAIGDACGELTMLVRSNGTLQEVTGPFGTHWAESDGRALVIGSSGKPEAVNASGPAGHQGIWVRLRVFANVTLDLARDEEVVLLMAAVGPKTAYDPTITLRNLTAATVLSTAPLAYRCGASLEDFRGTIVAAGAILGPTVVRDAALAVPLERPAWASFGFLGDPRTTSSCTIALESPEGQVVSETATDGPCATSAEGPPGEWTMRIDEATATGPLVAWTLREVIR